MNTQLSNDLQHTYDSLTPSEREKLSGSSILLTGAAGFLGYYLTQFLFRYRDELQLKRVICLDNFLLGRPSWLSELEGDSRFSCFPFDIVRDDVASIQGAGEADYILHMASIASPTFYRQYPIETLDANVWGLRRLLDYYADKPVKGILFFSSSEIYGDPVPEAVPTPETYFGNVCATGPRACYDEAKRFGETMCMLFAQRYGLPVCVVRPFNNYGPGMRLDDKRVPADFAADVLAGRDLVILSNGSPTRTFCYIADAAAGYLKALLYGTYDYFNIGIERPELSIAQLAELYCAAGRTLFNYPGRVVYAVSADQDYLTDNPQRRCPVLAKARERLGYNPSIQAGEGVGRFLRYLREECG